jgi:outer membrane immunogenic protein
MIERTIDDTRVPVKIWTSVLRLLAEIQRTEGVMKKLSLGSVVIILLVAGSAMATDPPPAVYRWTGFYLGGHGGYAWTEKTWRDPAGTELASYTSRGFLGGVQGGYNWQTGPWVLGAEAQASWGKIRKGVIWINPDINPWIDPGTQPIVTKRIGTTVDRLGAVALRAGHAWDRSLVYGKGGVAWAHDVYRVFNADTATETLIATTSGTRWGWTAGAGYEYAFAGNWSARVEYDYLGLGTKRITVESVPGVTPPTHQFDVRQNISAVNVGINYRF